MRIVWLALVWPLAAHPAAHLPSGDCSLCHTRIGSPPAGQYPLWRASVMARAGTDPYWKERVAQERAWNPKAGALIDDKCFRCHQPAMGDLGQEEGAKQGVTCTVCHRILPDGLGTKASFSGGFSLSGRKELYGPHERPFQMPMLMHTTMAPVEANHFLHPELCATCHTVITPVLDEQGRSVGEFYEQTPYLEWRASSFAMSGTTCQQCHMPHLAQPEYIAHRPPGGPFPPTRPRSPFAKHEFTGGNFQLLRATGGNDAAVLEQLGNALAVDADIQRAGQMLELRVTVTNLTGHKLPTGFPGRRLWLHVTALGAQGEVVFESGGANTKFPQPHRNRIEDPSQAMAWEARTKGPSLLLHAAWAQDNRILPDGFDPERLDVTGIPSSALLPVGVSGDLDFRPGSDTVRYALPAAARSVEVEAMFSSLPPLPPAVIARATAAVTSAKAELRRPLQQDSRPERH